MLDSRAVPDKTSVSRCRVNIDAQDEALREVRRIARGRSPPTWSRTSACFRGLFRARFDGMRSADSGIFDRRCRHEAAHRESDEIQRYRRLRSRLPLRQRRSRAGRPPSFFLDYYAPAS